MGRRRPEHVSTKGDQPNGARDVWLSGTALHGLPGTGAVYGEDAGRVWLRGHQPVATFDVVNSARST